MQFPTPVTDSLVDEVHALVRTFSPQVGSAHTDLFGTGVLDSANLVRLVFALEAQFAVTIPLDELDIDSIRSIARIANLVRERRSAEASRPAAMEGAPTDAEPHGVSERSTFPRQRAAAPALPPQGDPLIREIHDLFVNSLSVEVPSPDMDLFSAGILDSMLLVQLIMLLKDQFGLSLSLEDLDVAAISTTAGIAQLVRNSPAVAHNDPRTPRALPVQQ